MNKLERSIVERVAEWCARADSDYADPTYGGTFEVEAEVFFIEETERQDGTGRIVPRHQAIGVKIQHFYPEEFQEDRGEDGEWVGGNLWYEDEYFFVSVEKIIIPFQKTNDDLTLEIQGVLNQQEIGKRILNLPEIESIYQLGR